MRDGVLFAVLREKSTDYRQIVIDKRGRECYAKRKD